ncbi:MAG: aldose epimerase family protein [Opitutales bacterium]
MTIEKSSFGKLENGAPVNLFTLQNKNGLSAKITDYGGIIVALHVPDRRGNLEDIVLGKDSLADYLAGHPYFGCIAGRVAGRIAGAKFTLEGAEYELPENEPPDCLHGGWRGYDKMLWESELIHDNGVDKLQLRTTDPDGNNGFPGNVTCEVTYALLNDNTLEIHYTAQTDKTTPFNITNHSYFNLKGAGNGDVFGHEVRIPSSEVAVADENNTLLGRRAPVAEGYNDYRSPVRLGNHAPLENGNADALFFLAEGRTRHPKEAAVVREPETGRVMEVFTTEPCVQFYAGLHLPAPPDDPEPGKAGCVYRRCDGLCVETEDYPDSVHFPEMGNALLQPGETFASTTLFRFKTED